MKERRFGQIQFYYLIRRTERLQRQALQQLQPSQNAGYGSTAPDKCTPNTRVSILDKIKGWATDSSKRCPPIFWLTGQAGSGKTTIATTVAGHFDSDPTGEKGIILGASFFCSRRSPETRNPRRVVPTIAYQLAQKCRGFSDALIVANKFETVSYAAPRQLRSLMFSPWLQYEGIRDRTQPMFLLVIDALDELMENSATEFLDALFTLFNECPVEGLKILLTSRSDPGIVRLVQSFQHKAETWLQRVPLEEASSDVGTYLKSHLPNLNTDDLWRLQTLAGGLFVYAATVVRYLVPHPHIQHSEQLELLEELFSYTRNAGMDTSRFAIDKLYQHILHEALASYGAKQWQRRLKIVHMILSTGDRPSPSTISALLSEDGATPEIVLAVVQSLHAVLFMQDDRIFWFHGSFPDFIFDSSRSNYTLELGTGVSRFEFSCSEEVQQTNLCKLCFTWLESTALKFNIGNIASSYLLDKDDYPIHPLLAYSACNWSHHLPNTGYLDILSRIRGFMQLRALFWIELMNLMGKIRLSVSILQRVQRWVKQVRLMHVTFGIQMTVSACNAMHQQQSQNAGDLVEDLQEALNFTTQFAMQKHAELRRSTPHLYLSFLATWPEGTGIVSKWKRNFSRLPVPTHTNNGDIPVIFDTSQHIQVLSYVPSLAQGHDYFWSISFVNNDTQVVSGHADGSVLIWDASNGQLLGSLQGHKKDVYSVAGLIDGTIVVSGSADRTIRVWDTSTGSMIHTLRGHRDQVLGVAVWRSDTGLRIASGSDDRTVRIWYPDINHLLPAILTGHIDSVEAVAVSDNSAYLASGSRDGTVRIWDALTGQALHRLHARAGIIPSIAMCSDNVHIVSTSEVGTVRLWDMHTGEEMMSIDGRPFYNIISAAISPNNHTIFTGTRRNVLQSWNFSSGQELRVLVGHTASVFSLAVSRDGTRLVSGSDDGSIRIWDVLGARKSVLLRRPSSFSGNMSSREDRQSSPNSPPLDWALSFASVNSKCSQWSLHEDGWIVSLESDSHRLMWVDRRQLQVTDPSNILVMSAKGYGSVDLSEAIEIMGENWIKCYTPTSNNM